MGLRINTNVPSLVAQHHFSRTQRQTSNALSSLASGTRFNSPGVDPAGFAIAENIRSQVAGVKAAQNNTAIADSFIQTAEGSLNEQNNILIRMRELAVQAASDTYSNTEREFLNMEFEQLREEVDRIAETTSFGSTKLLRGDSKSYDFQVGVTGGSESRISFDNDANTTASELGVDGLAVSDKSDARSALGDIDEALAKIGGARAKFGAIQSRFESTDAQQSAMVEGLSAAYSRIADTDVAEAVTQARRGQILQQYQAAVLSQANDLASNALRLIA